jgi:hypothetical protein
VPTLLTVGIGQCRTPLWGDSTPMAEEAFVCGQPAVPGKSYCAGCRKLLIAGLSRPDGSAVWFRPVDEKRAGITLRRQLQRLPP